MELTEVTYEVLATGDKMPSGYYLKADVDAVIAELREEINNLLMQNRELSQALQVMYSAEEYTKLQDENAELKQKLRDHCIHCPVKEQEDDVVAELKQKLENVQASMYADVVDANMKIRRLQRALYNALANWAKCEERINNRDAYEASEYLPSAEDKFRKKAERWSEMERKCRAKAEASK